MTMTALFAREVGKTPVAGTRRGGPHACSLPFLPVAGLPWSPQIRDSILSKGTQAEVMGTSDPTMGLS